ncbi:MAG: class I adenylate-forming enzyme family protein, partial [Gemmatimonadales bacterium]
GWPVDEYELRIAASDSTVTPPGETGELQVRGDFLTLGYWKRPEATKALFTHDGWLHTGDLGTVNPDGSWRLLGRLKEMFKSGGYNVYPREIETVLESHPDVAMAAVIGVADPTFHEVGHAFVLVHPGRTPTPADLEQFCRESLANYKVPKRFIVQTDFPMLPIGKIDKQALRASQT